VTLLDQPPLALAQADARLAELGAQARAQIGAAVAVGLLGVALLAVAGGAWGVPVLIGAASALGLAGISRSDRRRLLTRLVAQDDAGALDEVRRFARRLLAPRERARLARALVNAARAPRTSELVVVRPERAEPVAAELLALARAIADPDVPLRPRSAALCLRLLVEAPLSPLYNPHVPATDLDRLLELIRGGVGEPR
jgi:hypothetical protein